MEAVGEAIGVFLAVASATSFFLGSDLGLGLNLDLGELNNETRLLGTFDFLLLLFSTENTALFFISLFPSVLITFLSMAGGVVMIFSVVDFGDFLLLLVFNLDLVKMLFLTLGLNNFFLVSKILGLGVVDFGLTEVLAVSRIFGSSAGDSTMRNGTC